MLVWKDSITICQLASQDVSVVVCNVCSWSYWSSASFKFCATGVCVQGPNVSSAFVFLRLSPISCERKVKVVCQSWSPRLEPPPPHTPSLWATVFPSSRFSIVNEEDRRERGLLVLICPGGSLGITINSQLWAHSSGLHRHCQFVPIREASFWVSAVRGCSGPTGEQPVGPWLRSWPHWAWLQKHALLWICSLMPPDLYGWM